MTLRIHFTSEDLTRITIAQHPDPLWEVLLSLHMLQSTDAAPVFARWRRQVRADPGTVDRRLLDLAPPFGYSPDFLTPAAAADGLEDGIDALRSTPRDRLRKDLTELSATRPPARWTRLLGDGDRDTLDGLAQAVRDYHRAVLLPHWAHIQGRLGADRSVRTRALLTGGSARLLPTLHPALCWSPPVLELRGPHVRGDLHLDGRGLRLVPSFFCWPTPTLLRDRELTPVLVYPIAHDLRWLGEREPRPASGRALAALLGMRRAAVLETVAGGAGCTTGEVARRVGISPATVSHHTSVLRQAGLIGTRRVGETVLHTATGLGVDLLNGDSCLAVGQPTGLA
ncbi:helix-turn-helix domain-containing protein [Streptomyces netropsis]|uniref:ArsR/SmtB family transcription factor n=1 Tax=Streptomyces netropsis TaxID=55404 RepID=UPI0037904F1B